MQWPAYPSRLLQNFDIPYEKAAEKWRNFGYAAKGSGGRSVTQA
jgi:hypothetical protein